MRAGRLPGQRDRSGPGRQEEWVRGRLARGVPESLSAGLGDGSAQAQTA